MSSPSSSIESVLVENRVFEPSAATVAAARVSGMKAYEEFVKRNPGRAIKLGAGPENDDYLELYQRLNGLEIR